MFVTHRVGSTEQAERADRLPRRGSAARRACARSSSGAERDRRRARRAADAAVSRPRGDPIPITQAVLRRRRSSRRSQRRCERLGRAGPARRASSRSASPPTPAPPHAVATTSCTTALHLAVAALGLGPGDEVIVPAFTWVSTAERRRVHGRDAASSATSTSTTFNIDAARSRPLSARRTVGIMPVHLFGLCADMDADPRDRRAPRAVGRRGRRLRASAPG